jgi:hypothetical protein
MDTENVSQLKEQHSSYLRGAIYLELTTLSYLPVYPDTTHHKSTDTLYHLLIY